MKTKKSYLLIFILSLSLTLLLHASTLNYSMKKNNSDKKIEPSLSGPGSLKVEWNRTWGDIEDEFADTINIDSLDNIYLSGFNRSHETGERDKLCLVKYNSAGDLQWDRAWGEEVFSSRNVILNSQNDIYITGAMRNATGNNIVIYLIKFNSSGDLQWNRTWGGIGASYSRAIALDSLNNIYLAGEISSVIFLVKFNSSGDLQWNRTWGGDYQSETEMSIDSFDNIYITGCTRMGGASASDLNILKYNSTGHLQWSHTLNESDYQPTQIAIDSTDNIFITGLNYILEQYNLFLMKYDLSGNQLWNRTWGGISDELAYKIAIDSSDNIYVGGIIRRGEMFDYWEDIFLVKYNNLGVRLWNQTWDKTEDDELADITIDSSDNIYLAGHRGYDEHNIVKPGIIILRYDSSGILNSETHWGGDIEDYATEMALDSSENIYISGVTRSFGAGESDMCIVKFVEKTSETLIPGYDLLLLILILSAVSIITVLTRFTKTLIEKKKVPLNEV